MKKYIIAVIVIIAIAFSYLIGHSTKDIDYDLNSDGIVDMADMSILLAKFSK